MGWQGRVKRRKERERVAVRFDAHWHDITVWCWRDHDTYWVSENGGPEVRVDRKTLERRPLRNGG